MHMYSRKFLQKYENNAAAGTHQQHGQFQFPRIMECMQPSHALNKQHAKHFKSVLLWLHASSQVKTETEVRAVMLFIEHKAPHALTPASKESLVKSFYICSWGKKEKKTKTGDIHAHTSLHTKVTKHEATLKSEMENMCHMYFSLHLLKVLLKPINSLLFFLFVKVPLSSNDANNIIITLTFKLSHKLKAPAYIPSDILLH